MTLKDKDVAADETNECRPKPNKIPTFFKYINKSKNCIADLCLDANEEYRRSLFCFKSNFN